MSAESVTLLLFVVAAIVALIARALRVPYTIALVVAGVGLSASHVIQPPHLTERLLYAIFLPGLLFEAAFHLELRAFWRHKLAIHALAVPGLLVGVFATCGALVVATHVFHVDTPYRWAHWLVFAALIGATDPIAVVALARELGAPPRLSVLMEAESLLNDGTAVVLFTVVLGAITGENVGAARATFDFVKMAGGGILVGLAAGGVVSRIIARVDEAPIEITLTSIAAYGSFFVGNKLQVSGVLATVACGMVCAQQAASAMRPTTRIAVESFWEYVAFALNSIVFLLIGLQVSLRVLLADWALILLAYGAVIVGRVATVGLVTLAVHPTAERIPPKWAVALGWGGLRGALPMVLSLAIPPEFPARNRIVTVTFGVVVLSILLQGLTMKPLLRWLKIVGTDGLKIEHGRQRARLVVARAAVEALDEIATHGAAHPEVIEELRHEYRGRAKDAEARIAEMFERSEELRADEREAVRHHLLYVERDRLQRAHRLGIIGEKEHAEILALIDARIVGDGSKEESKAEHDGEPSDAVSPAERPSR